jgi:hypothetical protein
MINETNYGAQINDGFDASLYNFAEEGLKLHGETTDDFFVVVIVCLFVRGGISNKSFIASQSQSYYIPINIF